MTAVNVYNRLEYWQTLLGNKNRPHVSKLPRDDGSQTTQKIKN